LPTKSVSAIAATSAGVTVEDSNDGLANIKPQIRTNLNETVFFYPHLETDKDGNVLISFKMNEALTKWKLMTLAHTKELQTVMETKEVITQKDLMVVPNPPRFVRDNDEIVFTSKINNLTDKSISGNVRLELLDAITMQPLTGIMDEVNQAQVFSIDAKQSAVAKWKLRIPERKVQWILCKISHSLLKS